VPRRLIVVLVSLFFLCALAAPGTAFACSRDDSNYFETFVDATCLQQPQTNTTLDALGGLRLTTNGTPFNTIWDTDTDFNTGVSYQSQVFPPVGVSTLHTSGTGAAATLTLPSTPLPLAPDAADPVLGPTASTVGDGDNVDDPTVAHSSHCRHKIRRCTPGIFTDSLVPSQTQQRKGGSCPPFAIHAGEFIRRLGRRK